MTLALEARLEQGLWEGIEEALHPNIALRLPDGTLVHGKKEVADSLRTFAFPRFKTLDAYENIQIGIFDTDLRLKIKYKDALINRLYLNVIDPSKRRFRMDIAYDGTLYHGFQRQKGKPTVQGAIEGALRHVMQETITITPSGRTDRGVHAHRQVVHFDTKSPLDVSLMLFLLKRMLPSDIEALSLACVPEVFHARFDVQRKTYHYTIMREKNPFMAHYAWVVPDVELQALNRTLERFIGTHDFTTFSKGKEDVKPFRTVTTAMATEQEGVITVTIESEGFLRHMVRYMVGTAIRDCEKHTREVEKGLKRPGEGHVYLAPASGLTLHDVRYRL